MIRRKNGHVHECVLVDLNTQRDLCDPSGLMPVANIRELIPVLHRVVAWSRLNAVPVISSIDSHRPGELNGSGRGPYCVDGTAGQLKIRFTVFPRSTSIEADNTLSVPLDLFRRYQQVIFRKRTVDLLGNPKADRFVTQLPVGEFLLTGIALEDSVQALALGLLARDKKVTLVADACGYWDRNAAEMAIRRMCAKGVNVTSVNDLVKRILPASLAFRTLSSGGHGGNGQLRTGANGHGANGNGRPMPRQNGRLPNAPRTTRMRKSERSQD